MDYTKYWASAYGTDAYGTQQYACAEGDTACLTSSTTNNGTAAGNPNTGLMAEPMVLVPVLAAIAVAIVVAEFFIRKFVRKRRSGAAAN